MRSKSENGFNWLALLFVSPVIVFLTVFTFYPFVRSIVMTFFVTDSLGNPGMFVGLRIWKKVLSSSEFKVSLGSTFKYSLAKGVLTFCLAMLMAFLCTKKTRRSKIYQTMFALPIAIASAPICAIVTYVFCRYGVFNAITGKSEAWLALSNARFWIIVLSSVWSSSGSSFIYLLVGFRNVPDELIECANLDGCGPVRRFFQIFIPIASPQIFFVIFLNILSAFKGFAIIKILVGNVEAPEVTTLILKLYQYAFVRDRYEIACVYGLILAVVIFVVSRIQFMVEKKVVFYQ